MHTSPSDEKEAAQASDIEQNVGHRDSLRDAGQGAEPPPSHREVGSSGHVPRSEELGPNPDAQPSASPGADADRRR